jgi:anti-sigma B factor antagonist
MKSEIKNGILVVPLEGSLVGALVSEPSMNLLNANLEVGNNKVLFNMKDLKYADSTGLGLLLKAVSKIKQAGGALVLCNMPEQVEKLLKMTKLESAFNRQPDEASAISFLAV